MASLRTIATLAALLVAFQSSLAYQTSTCNRRQWLSDSAASAMHLTITTTATLPQAAHASQYCASGVGEGCGNLSEGNDFIKSLQEKSAANKERYAKETRDAYYMKNYPDFFAASGKTLVKKQSDGTFLLLGDAELDQLKRNHQLTTEIPRAYKGQVADVTQKPILILKE